MGRKERRGETRSLVRCSCLVVVSSYRVASPEGRDAREEDSRRGHRAHEHERVPLLPVEVDLPRESKLVHDDASKRSGYAHPSPPRLARRLEGEERARQSPSARRRVPRSAPSVRPCVRACVCFVRARFSCNCPSGSDSLPLLYSPPQEATSIFPYLLSNTGFSTLSLKICLKN